MPKLTQWRVIPVPEVADDYDGHFHAIKLNSLGSLYWFTKYTLGKNRLSTLHKHLAKSLETEDLFLVMEVPMSHFKALDIRTPIPTPDGFKLMGHINVGDIVFGSDGLPVKVTGVSPIYFSSECYELEFTGGDKIDCDAGHLWETQSLEDYNNSKPKVYRSIVRTTKEIASKIDYGKQRNHRVKLAKSLQLPDVELPIDPYVLGCWLGDGTSATNSITIGKDDEWLAEEIKRCGEPIYKTRQPLRWQLSDGKQRGRNNRGQFPKDVHGFSGRLRSLGLIKNKHIPPLYMRASERQRLSLLQGLMDTDGTASKLGQCSFTNTNTNLILQVRELVCSLGLKCGELRTYKAKIYGEDVGWFNVITFYSFKDFSPFRMPRKVARLLTRSPQSMQSYRHIRSARKIPPRYVKCIMVDSPDSLYLAGHGFIPTHNTTLGIGFSIFSALPFTERDEEAMRKLGYGDAWIRWMKFAHDQNMRTLVTHEIAEQAAAIGKGVDEAYENNDVFREVFRSILPDRDCTWTNAHKFQKRLPGADPTTGTYEYRGVGQALQGIHVKLIIQDDNFGREAQKSLLKGDGRIVRDLIGWHKQVGTRFDPMVKESRRQLVIGNAWAHADLNAWIKKHQPEFKFETHSAEGGCCRLHPEGKPILPSEWTMELLHKEKARLEAGGDSGGEKGDYEHFYLNLHTLPWETIFDTKSLNYFKFKQSRPDLKLEDLRNILLLEHEVRDGNVIEDFQPGGLILRMIVDPNHAKKVNRIEHVIWVIGYDIETTKIYLLSLFADNSKYSELVEEIYRTARRWRLDSFWMGEHAAELLDFYIKQRDRTEPQSTRLSVNTFPDDDSQVGMKDRIESLEPIMRGKQIWAHRGSQQKFVSQLEMYPAGAVDTLDVLGNFTATIDVVHGAGKFLQAQREAFLNRGSGAGGY